MSSKELPDLSEMRLKISDMEKENLELRNQIEILNNELSQKTNILTQTNSELSDLQKQYKQALEKIVELSKKTSGRGLSPEEERVYRLQLAEQASCISTLQDRLWESENQRRFSACHNSSSNSFEQISNDNKNYNHQFDSVSSYRRSSFCDPIPNIDRAEKKIISLRHKLLDISKQNDYFYSELNCWSKFVIQVFNIASEALDEYPAFPYDDPPAQRKAALNAICKLAKAKNETPKLYEKYIKIKEKYREAKEYLNTIEQKCNHLSQVTQLNAPSSNICKKQNIIDSESSSDFNEADLAYYHKLKCSNKGVTKNMSNKMNIKHQNLYHHPACYNISQNDDYDDDYMSRNLNRKIYSKQKFDEKKIENIPGKEHFTNIDESDHFLDNQSENTYYNRKEYSSNNRQKIPAINQAKYSKKEIITNKNERIMNPNDKNDRCANYKQSIQNKTKINVNKQIKRQSKETSKFNKTYPQRNHNNEDDNDDLYSKFGANISRLSKITENMKNDYYDFAKLTKDVDLDNYSIEELSNLNSP
ncbi:hypothetical protein M9Y10_015204 [Tritrichomonas musculus]|uniref:Uncharacterized protein n=1 Tax=Tritrichomonas musculus TaxID=1915356 RepID=A0ABR2L1M8_9EUKA